MQLDAQLSDNIAFFHINKTGQGAASVWEVRSGQIRRTPAFQRFERAVKACLACFDEEVPHEVDELRADAVLGAGPHVAVEWIQSELARCGWPGVNACEASV